MGSLRAGIRPASASAPAARKFSSGGYCFNLSDDQKEIEEVAQKFAKDVIAPAAAHHDKTGEYPVEIIKQAHELGLMNTHIAQEYGGLGLDMVTGVCISEALAWGCTGISTAIEANNLAQSPLLVAATDAQKKKYLGRMTEEAMMAAYC